MKKVTLNINGCLPQVHDGKDGKDGVDGKSAYQIWLDNGNTGSEAEFLESLKGPKGTDGVIGKDGAVGPKGDKGEKGDKGDKGDTGEQGPMGAQGLRGEVGAKGDTGERGPQGEKGEQGLKGDKGDKGDTGPAGPQGPAGRDGEGADFCTAFDALPEVSWKKGTTIIAKQDGACVRLTSFDSIFQEIGVGITANKTNSLVGDDYRVVVTVSNTGEGKNELTNLNIVGPANTEDYEIKDVRFTKSEADEVEQVDNLTYNIRGLKKGGTVKVLYTVVPKVKGTYQFTAAVNPNSSLDKDLGNNNSTIILHSDTASKAITGENCPAITIKEKASDITLVQVAGTLTASTGALNILVEYRDIPKIEYSNVFRTRKSLQGLVLTCDAEVTAISRGEKVIKGVTGIGTDDGSVYTSIAGDIGTSVGSYIQLNPNATHVRTTNSISITGNEITVTEDVTELVLLVRPRGANCYWQAYLLFSETDPDLESITLTNLNGGTLTEVKTPKSKSNTVTKSNIVGIGLTNLSNIMGGYVNKQVVTVKKGTAATATLDFGSLTKFYSSGLVEITANSLTVSANATPSDSIRSTYLDVIIEE